MDRAGHFVRLCGRGAGAGQACRGARQAGGDRHRGRAFCSPGGEARADAQQGRRDVDADHHGARHHDERAGPGAVLRRHGALEERALDADAGVRGVLAGDGAVGGLRLQPRLHRGQRVLRRLRPAVPVGRARCRQGRVRDRRDLLQGRGDPGDRVRRVPGHLCGHHLLPDPRRLRRARQVRGGARVHRAVVHLQLRADRAHGVVLDGPGCLHRSEARRWPHRQGRPDLAVGRARLRGRHGGAHQRRRGGPGGRLPGGQAHRLRQGSDAGAQPAAHDDRGVAAVGGLVRLQRRLRARGRQFRGACVPQHLPGDRLRGAVLEPRRGDLQGQADHARRRLGRGGGPRGHHPGRRQRRCGRRVRHRPGGGDRLPLGRDPA